ncbi:MAG: Holliday junction branch migration protein RuvA [Clostridia bacterium]|nr:Holliday junction branch migration protein RuvA [Clostridia bacterium]
MFYYVNGTLAVCEGSTVVVDCGGVGYKLTVSDNTFSKVAGKMGSEVKLFTHLSVREDAIELFGFSSNDELSAFKMLISVSGVGPKAAMAILSIMTPEKFAFAVSTGDVKGISKANNVGKRTAERIILELKDKVAKELSAVDTETGEVYAQQAETETSADAVSALMVLGFTKAEAVAALAGANPADPLEKQIKAALARLAARF